MGEHYKVEILKRHPRRSRVDLSPGRLDGSVPRAARPVDRLYPRLQADQRGRRVLARRRAQRDALADLRDLVREQGGAGGASEAARTRALARPSQARPRDGSVRVRSDLARLAVFPAQGRDHLQRARRLHAPPVPALRLRGSDHAAGLQERAVAYLGPLGQFSREHVPDHRSRGRGGRPDRFESRGMAQRLRVQADELSGAYVHLPRREAFATATCRCASPTSAGSIAPSARARCTG